MITIDDSGAAPLVQGLALDVVFPVLHGTFGEDGTMQGLLELAGVPYVGPGVLASAVGMDKAMMKTVFEARGLPVTPWRAFLAHDWARRRAAVLDELRGLGLPVFVKPANLGSSVGISKVKRADDLGPAIEAALAFDRKVIVGRRCPTRARSSARCSATTSRRPRWPASHPSREFYDYEAKCLDAASRTVIPADLPAGT